MDSKQEGDFLTILPSKLLLELEMSLAGSQIMHLVPKSLGLFLSVSFPGSKELRCLLVPVVEDPRAALSKVRKILSSCARTSEI